MDFINCLTKLQRVSNVGYAQVHRILSRHNKVCAYFGTTENEMYMTIDTLKDIWNHWQMTHLNTQFSINEIKTVLIEFDKFFLASGSNTHWPKRSLLTTFVSMKRARHKGKLIGGEFNIKTPPYLFDGRLTFVMRIPILVRRYLYIQSAPRCLWIRIDEVGISSMWKQLHL